jgi:hypothetical protein
MLKVLITEIETGDTIYDMECDVLIAGLSDANNEGHVHGFTYARNTDSFTLAGCANTVEKEIHGLFDRHPEREHLTNYLKVINEIEEITVDEEVQ